MTSVCVCLCLCVCVSVSVWVSVSVCVCVTLATVQAVAIAAMYLACKVNEVSGSGVNSGGCSREDSFPDKDRGSLQVLVRHGLQWTATHERLALPLKKNNTDEFVRPWRRVQACWHFLRSRYPSFGISCACSGASRSHTLVFLCSNPAET
jgi:hypothetical protein